jgi:magnesium chelatase subunit D
MSLDAQWAELARAIAILAVDPRSVGGVILRGRPGPARDRVLAWLQGALPSGTPWVRMPPHITEDRLVGGLALADTLRAGRPVIEPGILARADRGLLVCAMAERMSSTVASVLATALDRGEIRLERDGLTARLDARVAIVLLDEGIDDERAPQALRDRLALAFDVDALPPLSPEAQARLLAGEALDEAPRLEPLVDAARRRLSDCRLEPAAIEALSEAATTLGIGSIRAPLLAAHVARIHAALEARATVADDDLAVAARLVLAPRATRAPEAAEPSEPSSPPPDEASTPDEGERPRGRDEVPSDIVVDAAESAIASGMLDRLRPVAAKKSASSAGRSGAKRAATSQGRPAGVRAARGDPGERINVVETLRAAAPWQRLRGRDDERVRVRASDLRVSRRIERTETTVVFCVDVSGSSATQRLAEAKGAIERILHDCYARRDQVAVVAFRRNEAALVLPATRSLARARRCLAGIAGGGTTPLARGLDEARAVALDARGRGRAALLVVMTDGRANVALDGTQGSEPGRRDASQSARAIHAEGIPTLLVDTSPRPREAARALADALGATYVPLPHPGSERIPDALDAIRDASGGGARP